MNKNLLPPFIRKIAVKLKNKMKEYKLIDDLRAIGALQRISQKGINVHSIIDIGASDGSWSKMCMSVYPNAEYFLVEAQKPHEPKLLEFTQKHSNSNYIIAAAGNDNGEIWFDNTDLFGGVASKTPTQNAKKSIPMIKVDSLVEKHNLSGPFLLKLDTHGFELPILEGAANTLKAANIVVIEVYNFQVTNDSLLFDEMCCHMRKLGFRVIDMSEPMWRTKDGSLWQMDLFFIRSDNSLFSDIGYN